MKYIFMIISMAFFLGCSPKYRINTQHVMPTDEAGKSCISKCQKSYGSCKEICKANFDICKDKAKNQAQKNFDKKMHEYHIRLEQYASDIQMHHLERDLFYFNGYYGYGYSRQYYYPRHLYWIDTYPNYYRPLRPLKPSLQAQIELAQISMCQIDCGCTKTYDSCFTGCGGKIEQSKTCIENCPSDR